MNLYLDNAATTKPNDEVLKVMNRYFCELWYNPSSIYSKGQRVKKDIDAARKNIANFINANAKEIIFTSGGSESNCTAIQGFINKHKNSYKKPMIITTTIEHKSILECINNICEHYCYIPVDNQGFIDISTLEEMLINNCENYNILVTVGFANNEIGTIQDIKTIAKIVHHHGAYLHCDATQAFGHIPIDVKDLDVDMMTVSGHKIQAPKGIGFLYIKNGIEIKPLIYGTQENSMRGGTENVPYIIGLAEAVKICKAKMQTNYANQLRIRNYLWQQLRDEFGCTLNGSGTNRLANNVNVTFPQNITGEALIYMLDTAGYNVSAGSACNSQTNQPSHVLKAIGLADRDIMRTIRITLPDTADNKLYFEDIDKFIDEIKKCLCILTTE